MSNDIPHKMLQVLHNKILAEVHVEAGEKKTASGIVLSGSDEKKFDFLEAEVVSAGSKVNRGLEPSDPHYVSKGDRLIVFNVYRQQIFDYVGRQYIFVNFDDAFYFKI